MVTDFEANSNMSYMMKKDKNERDMVLLKKETRRENYELLTINEI